ncbi:MAG: T9SS type A sorting domain-containing protein, partial [Bacteroidota bacterium]
TVTEWPTASDITYGDALSASDLSGGTTSVSGTFSFDSPATTPDAGVYTAGVTFTPDDMLNYNTVSGTVEVNVEKDSQSIEWTQDLTGLAENDIITLTASATSGLTVTYSTTDTDIISITGDQLEILSTGTATITASQTGNENYYPADDVNKTIDILVSIGNQKTSLEISVYPVPAHNRLNISADRNIQSLCITDMTGKIVTKETAVNAKSAIIQIEQLKPGQYQIVVETSDGQFATSFIKQ